MRVVVSSPSAGARLEAFEFTLATLAAGNTEPLGLWSDGTTMWVTDTGDAKLYAYKMSDRSPDPAKDLTLATGNNNPRGIWSDGTIIWVADSGADKLYAYALASRTYVPAKDLTLAAENDVPRGIWSDGITLWVANLDFISGSKLYAYSLVSKARIPAKDFNTLSEAGNVSPTGIWSDGTTMWVTDNFGDKLYAYEMSDKTRSSDKDFTNLAAAGNDRPFSIWSDGTTMWVADEADDKIYAYDARLLVNTSTLATVRAGLEQIAQAPDLLLSISPSSVIVTSSATLTLTAQVINYGSSLAPTTTLRWYHSSDGTIDTNDTLLATNSLSSLAAGDSLTISNMLAAPSAVGTYHYGACVDPVMGEHYTGDNCFAVKIIVSTHSPLPASDFNTLNVAQKS